MFHSCIIEPDFQTKMNEDQTDWFLNTLSELNHFVTTMKSDIYFMRHCLLTVIAPAREHSETHNTFSKCGQERSLFRRCVQSHQGPQMSGYSPHPSLMKRGQTAPQLNKNSHLICFARLKQCCKHFSKLISTPLLHAWLSWCCTSWCC